MNLYLYIGVYIYIPLSGCVYPIKTHKIPYIPLVIIVVN